MIEIVIKKAIRWVLKTFFFDCECELFDNVDFFWQELANASDAEKDREAEKAARVVASLREREKEVQRTLAVHLRDRDNEREQHKHDEAVHHFNALLADLVSRM